VRELLPAWGMRRVADNEHRNVIPEIGVRVFVLPEPVETLHQLSGALHTNCGQFYLDAMASNAVTLMQCSETELRLAHLTAASTFHLQSHYIWQL